MAEAAEFSAPLERPKLLGDRWRSEINPADGARNSFGPGCKIQQKFRLAQRGFRLDCDGSVDVILQELRSQVSGKKIALQDRHCVRDPAVTPQIVLPEMLMSVDDHRIHSGRGRRTLPVQIKETAIERVVDASEKAGLLRTEKKREICDFVRLAHAADRL